MKKLLVMALLLSSGYILCCGDQKCGCSKPKPRPQARPTEQTRCPNKPADEKCPCEEKAQPAHRR